MCEFGRKKRGSAWWDDEVKELVKEKRRLFEKYMVDRNERNREEYRQKNQEVKRVTKQKKNDIDERDGINLSRKFTDSQNDYLNKFTFHIHYKQDLNERPIFCFFETIWNL